MTLEILQQSQAALSVPEMHDRVIVATTLYLQSLGQQAVLLTKDSDIVNAALVPIILVGSLISAASPMNYIGQDKKPMCEEFEYDVFISYSSQDKAAAREFPQGGAPGRAARLVRLRQRCV